MVPQMRMDGQRRSWLGKALACNGDGHLAMMEHEAGIEWVTGHRLGMDMDLGMNSGLGINSLWQRHLAPIPMNFLHIHILPIS